MKAPDKIYVSSDPFGFMHAYDMENHPPHGEEYIRKDALLEWLQPRANELKQRWLANPADKEAFCKEQVFSSILDKLNSM